MMETVFGQSILENLSFFYPLVINVYFFMHFKILNKS
jgi:hypothetical protein